MDATAPARTEPNKTISLPPRFPEASDAREDIAVHVEPVDLQEEVT